MINMAGIEPTDNDDRPVDDPTVGYRCADCGTSRDWAFIDMVSHPQDDRNRFPICADKPCSIHSVTLPSANDPQDGRSSE